VEGVVTLLATAIGAKRVLGDRDALISVAMLGAAPLFAFQAASFYAHTATTMWLAIALAGIAIWSEDGRDWPLPLAGMAIGCALLTRPLDAVLFSVALLSLWSLRVVVGVGLGAAPFGALSLLYNRAQFGSPFRDGYRAYSATMGSIYGPREMVRPVSLSHLVDGEQIYNHLDILRGLVVDWTVPGTALLALLGWVALRDVPRTRAVRRFLAVLTVLFALVLFVSFGGPDDGARPRYLSTLLLPLAWFAGPGWRSVAEFLRKRLGGGLARSVVVAAWLLAPLELGAFLYVRTPQLWIREGLAQAVEAAGIERATIVVLAEYPSRYTRNGPFFDRAVLYVSPQLATDLDEIAQVFPGRPVYEAHEGKKWSLVRVR
jgi:hypothetical protein